MNEGLCGLAAGSTFVSVTNTNIVGRTVFDLRSCCHTLMSYGMS